MKKMILLGRSVVGLMNVLEKNVLFNYLASLLKWTSSPVKIGILNPSDCSQRGWQVMIKKQDTSHFARKPRPLWVGETRNLLRNVQESHHRWCYKHRVCQRLSEGCDFVLVCLRSLIFILLVFIFNYLVSKLILCQLYFWNFGLLDPVFDARYSDTPHPFPIPHLSDIEPRRTAI